MSTNVITPLDTVLNRLEANRIRIPDGDYSLGITSDYLKALEFAIANKLTTPPVILIGGSVVRGAKVLVSLLMLDQGLETLLLTEKKWDIRIESNKLIMGTKKTNTKTSLVDIRKCPVKSNKTIAFIVLSHIAERYPEETTHYLKSLFKEEKFKFSDLDKESTCKHS